MSYTWSAYTGAGTQGYYHIASSSDGTKIVSGVFGGYIYTSTDSGATFTERTGAGSRSWYALNMSADGSTILAGDLGGYIYVSTDGGATWNEIQVSGTTRSWSSAKVSANGSIMYAGTTDNYIYKSIDSGVNWTQVTSAGTGAYYGITMSADSTIVYVTNANNSIIKSIDSGATWNNTGSGSFSWRGIATSSNGLYVIAGTFGGSIYVSSNSGSTWTSIGVPGDTYLSVAMSSDGSKMFGCTTNALYYSSNYGVTWTTLSVTGGPNNMKNLTVSSSGSKIALTNQGTYIYLGAGPEPPAPIICFRDGSKILTFNPATGREEYTAVENIRPGTLVKTRMSGYVPVCMVGTSTVTIPNDAERTADRLYVCSKDQFPELTEDLYITGHHSLLVNNMTDAEREECAEEMGRVYMTEGRCRLPAHIDRRTRVYETPGAVERIWHFALENNDEQMNYGVYANGLLVESCSIWRLRTMVGYELMTGNVYTLSNTVSAPPARLPIVC